MALQQEERGEAEDTAADLIAQISVVVQKLSKALQDQEQASGRADMLLAETQTTRKHDRQLSAPSTASVEHNRDVSRQTSTSQRSSTTSHSSYSYDAERLSPEPAKLPAIAEQNSCMHNYPDAARPLPRNASMSDGSVPSPSRSSSKAASPDLNAGSWAGDRRFDTRPFQPSRALSEPYQVHHTQLWPPQAAIPAPVVHSPFIRAPDGSLPYSPSTSSLPHSLPSTPVPPPRTVLPSRPRYYIANPDPGTTPPVELLGDIGKHITGGRNTSWPASSPQVAYDLPKHPALRYPYDMPRLPEGDRPRSSTGPEQLSMQAKAAESVSTLRPSLLRADSASSETLPRVAQWAPQLAADSAGATTSMTTGTSAFEAAQVDQLMDRWNERDFPRAEAILQDLHRQATSFRDPDVVRRVQHMLGVVASAQGHWQQALACFLSVLRVPMSDDERFDDGDCAAAYWLGDTYCLHKRPAEALMAYLVAEHGSLFRGTHLRQRILAEQKGCIGVPNNSGSTNDQDWRISWEREEKKVDRSAPDSILQPHILAKRVEQKLLDRARVRAQARTDSAKQHILDTDHSRVMAFRVLGADAGSYDHDYRLRIGASAFETTGPWPLLFDPFFAMANVVRGQLIPDPCDLLSLVKFDTSLRIPKAGFGNKKTYFTHHDLQWLIATVRACLSSWKMTVFETANAAECRFVASCPATSSFHEREQARCGVATFNFLIISLSRSSGFGKSGYVLDVAGEPMYSARIVRGDWLHAKGIPTAETERVRNAVLEYLNTAAKQQQQDIASFPRSQAQLASKTSKKRGALGILSPTSSNSITSR